MSTDRFTGAMGYIDDDLISDAVTYMPKKKYPRRWMKWGAIAACLCAVVFVGIRIGSGNDFVPLNISTITDASYSAPLITSTIEYVPATEEDVVIWLGFDLCDELPKELKNYTLKFLIIEDSKNDENLGVIIEGKEENSETPKPQFYVRITEGKVVADLLFDYDITTDIDGVTVIAGAIPGEMKTNRDGEEKYWPTKYFSLFDVGMYHCAVETQGQVSEDTFSELNNIIIGLLSKR